MTGVCWTNLRRQGCARCHASQNNISLLCFSLPPNRIRFRCKKCLKSLWLKSAHRKPNVKRVIPIIVPMNWNLLPLGGAVKRQTDPGVAPPWSLRSICPPTLRRNGASSTSTTRWVPARAFCFNQSSSSPTLISLVKCQHDAVWFAVHQRSLRYQMFSKIMHWFANSPPVSLQNVTRAFVVVYLCVRSHRTRGPLIEMQTNNKTHFIGWN